MMKWNLRAGVLILGCVFLSHCSFPPPTTSDAQTQSPNSSSSAPTQKQMVAQNNATIKSLQDQLDKLQGKLDVMGYEMEQIRSEHQKQAQDFDSRIAVLETQDPTPVSTAEIARNVPVASSEPVDATNIDLLIKNANMGTNLSPTILGLQTWIDKNPKDKKHKEAQFALSKAYYLQQDYPRAIQNFQTVVDEYPKSDQACDSRYHQGLSFLELKDTKNAQLFFEETIALCPKHEARKKSEKEIKKLTS